ncbi:DUF4824 family protein [Pseudomonas sp.]|uniref:DUF4824 family protein n=1 Tax=Pseudomonas sp. TaxID=306 RepID=UPI004053C0CA
MSGVRARYLIAGLLLIGLVNAIVLAGVAWNRQPPEESRLQLSERELAATYAYWRKDNSSLALRLDYRWPSQADDEHYALSISAEKMAELGFQVPTELNEQTVRRYRRQLDRDALLVLELDGPAYQREVSMLRDAHAEALRLQKAVPDSQELREAAQHAANALDYEQRRASRLLAVDVGLDVQALRMRYPDRARYAIVRSIIEAQASSVAIDWTENPRPDNQRWTWQLGGSADTPGLHSLNLPQRWHATFDSLLQQGEQSAVDYLSDQKLFSAEVAFGRRLEPWFVDLSAREVSASQPTTKVQ